MANLLASNIPVSRTFICDNIGTSLKALCPAAVSQFQWTRVAVWVSRSSISSLRETVECPRSDRSGTGENHAWEKTEVEMSRAMTALEAH